MDSLCCGDQSVLHPPIPCTLAVAQLVRCGGELTELVVWVGCCHCSQSAAQTALQGLHMSVYLSLRFKIWHFDDHTDLSVFKAVFVLVLG